MSEAPKKIWVSGTEGFSGDWGTVDTHPDDILYVRADVVHELVEALKEILEEPYDGIDVARIARVALAKLEEINE